MSTQLDPDEFEVYLNNHMETIAPMMTAEEFRESQPDLFEQFRQEYNSELEKLKIHVVNMRRVLPDLYCGRQTRRLKGSALANPFRMKTEVDRDRVIADYEQWLDAKIKERDPDVLAELKAVYDMAKNRSILGITLGCWCAPKPCHVDIIIKYLHLPRVITILESE